MRPPVFVPERFDPVTVPLAATEVGVILPKPIAIVPLVVIGEPLMVTPCDPDAATLVTVPPGPAATALSTYAVVASFVRVAFSTCWVR